MLVSGFLSGTALMGVQVRRETLFPTDAGSPLLVRYTIRNKNRFMPSFALTIEELETPKRRRVSAANWPRFMPRPVAFVPHLPPKGVAVVDAAVMPWARGRVTFEALRVSTTFPFGLTFKSVVFVQKQDVSIRPWRPALLPGALRRLLGLAGHAERSVQRRGVGEEMYALRDYRTGESSRAIAWKPTARHGRLIVRETAQRSPASVCVAVGGASSPASRERVISLVAAVASRASAEGLEVGIAWTDAGVSIAPSASPNVASRVLEALASGDERRLMSPAPSPSDRSTKIVIHEGATMAPIAGQVMTLSVDDPMVTDASAWLAMPRAPEALVRPRERSSIWKRVAKLLGGLG